jgi:hypothetical protein
MQIDERIMPFPSEWRGEYRLTGTVARWRSDYPDLFGVEMGNTTLGTLALFAQYALMYLLRSAHGVHSITWYTLVDTSRSSINRERTTRHWHTMKRWMGEAAFTSLQSALQRANLTDGKGEPDLFCWHPQTGSWFFAEAKLDDRLLPHQVEWFRTCRDCLGADIDIRVYRLVPSGTGSSP